MSLFILYYLLDSAVWGHVYLTDYLRQSSGLERVCVCVSIQVLVCGRVFFSQQIEKGNCNRSLKNPKIN